MIKKNIPPTCIRCGNIIREKVGCTCGFNIKELPITKPFISSFTTWNIILILIGLLLCVSNEYSLNSIGGVLIGIALWRLKNEH